MSWNALTWNVGLGSGTGAWYETIADTHLYEEDRLITCLQEVPDVGVTKAGGTEMSHAHLTEGDLTKNYSVFRSTYRPHPQSLVTLIATRLHPLISHCLYIHPHAPYALIVECENIVVINVHLKANGNNDNQDESKERILREKQAQRISSFLVKHSEPSKKVILLGDFNDEHAPSLFPDFHFESLATDTYISTLGNARYDWIARRPAPSPASSGVTEVLLVLLIRD